MARRVLSHTADTGVEANAETLPALIGELAAGMFDTMATLEHCKPVHRFETMVEADTLEDLVVDLLSELLWSFEVEGVMLCDFRVDLVGPPYRATVEAGAIPKEAVEVIGPPVKAVTYHELVVEREDHDWYGKVYFDV